jgi:hypothetical protein
LKYSSILRSVYYPRSISCRPVRCQNPLLMNSRCYRRFDLRLPRNWMIDRDDKQSELGKHYAQIKYFDWTSSSAFPFIERVILSGDKRVIFSIRSVFFFCLWRIDDYTVMHRISSSISINKSSGVPSLDGYRFGSCLIECFAVIFNLSPGDLDRRNISICTAPDKIRNNYGFYLLNKCK